MDKELEEYLLELNKLPFFTQNVLDDNLQDSYAIICRKILTLLDENSIKAKLDESELKYIVSKSFNMANELPEDINYLIRNHAQALIQNLEISEVKRKIQNFMGQIDDIIKQNRNNTVLKGTENLQYELTYDYFRRYNIEPEEIKTIQRKIEQVCEDELLESYNFTRRAIQNREETVKNKYMIAKQNETPNLYDSLLEYIKQIETEYDREDEKAKEIYVNIDILKNELEKLKETGYNFDNIEKDEVLLNNLLQLYLKIKNSLIKYKQEPNKETESKVR